jgi:Spy/CpxP family protein refolding chaperone
MFGSQEEVHMEKTHGLKRLAVAGLIGGAILAFAGVAQARSGRWHDPAHFEAMIGKRLDRMLDEVKATPEQRQQIGAIKDRLVAKHRALGDARVATRQELLAQWDAATPDMARVHARIDERAKEMQAFAHDAADAMNEVHAILTPEQRAIVAQHWKRRAAGAPPTPAPAPTQPQ